jgi:uncharacterized membrane protein YbhN (UPF0104 family)
MISKGQRIARLGARILVATILLVWVFSQVDLSQFRQTISAAKWHYLIGVWLFTAAFFWMQSLAMQLILRKQDCRVGVNTLFGISSITALYSLVLPGILSTGVKWYILKRLTGKGSNVLSSMLYNQATLSVVMAIIGLAALIVTTPASIVFPGVQRTWVAPMVSGFLLIVIVVVSVLLLNRRTGPPVTRLLDTALKLLPGRVRDRGAAMLTQITVFQTAGFRFHALIAVINALNGLFVGLLIYFSAARAARISVSIGVLLWLCAVLFLLSKIPITIANLGVREVTLVGLLAGYGVERSQALLMSMILFSSLVFMAALGAVYQLFWWAARQGGNPDQGTAGRPAQNSRMQDSEEIQ